MVTVISKPTATASSVFQFQVEVMPNIADSLAPLALRWYTNELIGTTPYKPNEFCDAGEYAWLKPSTRTFSAVSCSRYGLLFALP